jgi:hypothetical protein
VTTYSCHYLIDEEFRKAIEDFLVRESSQVWCTTDFYCVPHLSKCTLALILLVNHFVNIILVIYYLREMLRLQNAFSWCFILAGRIIHNQ